MIENTNKSKTNLYTLSAFFWFFWFLLQLGWAISRTFVEQIHDTSIYCADTVFFASVFSRVSKPRSNRTAASSADASLSNSNFAQHDPPPIHRWRSSPIFHVYDQWCILVLRVEDRWERFGGFVRELRYWRRTLGLDLHLTVALPAWLNVSGYRLRVYISNEICLVGARFPSKRSALSTVVCFWSLGPATESCTAAISASARRWRDP